MQALASNVSPHQDSYNELAYYTLTHPSPAFIHQHVVDAFAAQNATQHFKSITVAFALIGLYLHVEKGFSGREVQKAHMQLARKRKQWPRFIIPENRGAIRISDVLSAPPGPKRDGMIDNWCKCVWDTWSERQTHIATLVRCELRWF